MTARTLRGCFSTGLLASALILLHGGLALSASDDAGLDAVGKCAVSAGTATGACGIASKGVLDFLAKTPEAQAWAVGMSCNDGGATDVGHDKFVEIRRQASQWGKSPGNPPRITSLTKITGSDKTMCMFNAIVGSNNCMALLVADRDAFHHVDAQTDPTKGWRAKFCK